MYNEIGGKCITLCISADHRRFRSKLRVLNNWRWSGGWHQGLAAVPVGGGRAWPGFEPTRRAEGSQRGRRAGGPPPNSTHSGLNEHQQHYKHHQCVGCRRVRRAWPQCWWAAAGPGRASRRRAEHQQHCKRRRCGGCRRVRRAQAGFEIDHSERSSRVAISRAAGPDGARNNSGATSNTAQGRGPAGPRP